MPELLFHVEHVESEPHSATPMLLFKLRIDQAGAAIPIHAIALRCQIRIEPGRRRYTPAQQEALVELFGPPAQWGQSLRPMLWTHASTIVPAFAAASAVADLPVACTYDLCVAATKYFDALADDGEVPLCLLFSGTVFYEGAGGSLQTAPISWNTESNFRLPMRVWLEMMDRHYPNSAWLCLNKDSFDALRRFKVRAGHASWEQALDDLLQCARQPEKVLG